LFDLLFSLLILAAGDVAVDGVVSENRIDSMRLVERPSRIEFIDQTAYLLSDIGELID